MTDASNQITVVHADLGDHQHQSAILQMLDGYAIDPMGDGQPLADDVRANLIHGLSGHPTTLIFLAMQLRRPVGIAVCFRGFSTFAAKPLTNLHDFYVDAEFRGQGVGRMLMDAVCDEAVHFGCCKVTLEVQQNNSTARAIYQRFGFARAVYAADAESGGTLFYTKGLAK